MNATGMNTAARIERDRDDRPGHLGHRADGRLAWRHPLFDVVLDRFDDDDRVVDDESNREHQPEERQRVDGEPEQREER
jgi:hypothetical protein